MRMRVSRFRYKRSKQRDRILDVLINTDTHPTATWLYDRLKKDFSNLSMGTVYRNINILIDQNLIKKIDTVNNCDRYDANMAPHYHFICRHCGSVHDLNLPILAGLEEEAKKHSDFEVEAHTINFYGICHSCS